MVWMNVRGGQMKRLILTTVAAAALAVPFAGRAMGQSKTIVGDTQGLTASIESIERSTRAVTLKKDNGEYHTITVPSDVSKFDAMKNGDKITVRYYDNVVLRLKAPGEKDKDSDTAALTGTTGSRPGGTGATQRPITATIIQTDP